MAATQKAITSAGRPRTFYGASLAEVFTTPEYDCSIKDERGTPNFALTRLRGGAMPLQRAPAYPPDQALLVCVALTPTSVDKWRARIAGREVGVTRSIAFATTVIDLMEPMEMWAAGPFDYLHYYISSSLLDKVARENQVVPVDSYRMVFFEEDLVVAQLTKTILSQIRNREPLSLLALEDVSLLISTHLLQHYGTGSRELLRPTLASKAGRKFVQKRWCARACKATSQSLSWLVNVAFHPAISRVASGKASVSQFISGSSSFESKKQRSYFATLSWISSRSHSDQDSATRRRLPALLPELKRKLRPDGENSI